MKWISVKDKLPESGQYVLVWAGNVHQKPMCRVAMFKKGISKGERERLKKSGDKRAIEFHQADEDGNNKKPFCWLEFGPMKWFGQDVSHWMPLPEPPKQE